MGSEWLCSPNANGWVKTRSALAMAVCDLPPRTARNLLRVDGTSVGAACVDLEIALPTTTVHLACLAWSALGRGEALRWCVAAVSRKVAAAPRG